VTVTVEVADAVQELTVNAGTAGQFADAPVAGAIASALLLFCGAPVAIAGLLLVVAGTVAVAVVVPGVEAVGEAVDATPLQLLS